MTNLCVRCEQTGDIDRMVTVVNPYHNGPEWIEVCQDCVILGDRVMDVPLDEDEEWGTDSAQQQMERGH